MLVLRELVLQSLQCPGCLKIMLPPIRLCSRGHDACDVCARKHTVCVKCKCPYTMTRNLALETISQEIGTDRSPCNERCSCELIENHLSQCGRAIYKCNKQILRDNYAKELCKWSGSILDVYNHFRMVHSESLYELSLGKKFCWKLPYKQDQIDFSIIMTAHQKFLHVVFYDDKTSKVHYAVYSVDKHTRDGYKYEIKINGGRRSYSAPVYDGYTSIKELAQSNACIGIQLTEFSKLNADRNILWLTVITKL